MGGIWFRMQVRPGLRSIDIVPLIREQAAAFRALPYLWDTGPFRTNDPEADPQARTLLQRFQECTRAIRGCLIFNEGQDEDLEESDFPVSMRIYTFTRNPILPPEWRFDTYRTFLPEELPALLEQWRPYLAAISQREYQSYLFQLYLHEMTSRLFEHWRCLTENAALARSRTSPGSAQTTFTEMCDEIAKLRPPLIHPAPLWTYWHTDRSQTDYTTEPVYHNLQQYDNLLIEFTKAFDSYAQATWKVRRYQPLPTFDAFLKHADDPWLEIFLDWVEDCWYEKQGLFLDC